MTTFKTGDKVRFTRDNPDNRIFLKDFGKKGEVGEVAHNYNDVRLLLKMNRPTPAGDGTVFAPTEILELVEDTPEVEVIHETTFRTLSSEFTIQNDAVFVFGTRIGSKSQAKALFEAALKFLSVVALFGSVACGDLGEVSTPVESLPGVCHETGVDTNPFVFRPCDNDPEEDGFCRTRLFLDTYDSPLTEVTSCRPCTSKNGFTFEEVEQACESYDLPSP